MKKILILFLTIFSCFSNIAAKEKNYIDSDNVDVSGNRTITSKDETLYTANGGFMTKHRLIAKVNSAGDSTFFLLIRFNGNKMTMEEGSALLLKLGSGKNIELKSNRVGPADIDFVSTMIGSTYFVNGFYEITEEQIQEIIENDVIKIRVQWSGGTFDKEIKKQAMSKMLSKAYPAIKAALSEQKSLYDDF